MAKECAARTRAGGTSIHEVHVDATVVRRLVSAQFPTWAGLPLAPVASAGTDNHIFRLGSELCVRLPRAARAAGQVEKEQRWLPLLAPTLPLQIPLPLARGRPGGCYPWPWSVYRWLEGTPATVRPVGDPLRAARALAAFLTALWGIDPAGGPPAGPQNGFRGMPLTEKDAETRAAIATLGGVYDTGALTAAWEACLRGPPWARPAVWVHGDLHAANLLVRAGRLAAVIDFGLLGVGDPACDLAVAWSLLDGAARRAFRQLLRVDPATWARGRGWALGWGLIAFAHYRRTDNRTLAGIARRAIDAALADG